MSEARQQRVNETRAILKETIERVKTSDGWLNFLKGAATFHRYSLNNQWLIWAQAPETVAVKGFKAWKKLGRQVMKGEKAIWIMAPRPYTAINDKTGDEEARISFGSAAVFAFEQTEPIPDFEGVVWEPIARPDPEGDPEVAEKLWNALIDFCAAQPGLLKVVVGGKGHRNANGSFSPDTQTIWIKEKPDAFMAMLRTLIHEIGHYLTYHELGGSDESAKQYQYRLGEVVAESIAFVVEHHFGIDTGEGSAVYIARWEQEGDFEAAAGAVQRGAGSLLDFLEPAMSESAGEREDVAA